MNCPRCDGELVPTKPDPNVTVWVCPDGCGPTTLVEDLRKFCKGVLDTFNRGLRA